MTYDQYWNEDCCLVKYFRKAYEIQKERDNEKMWLQGMYIYEALCDVAPVLHAFAKKGTKPTEYSARPYPITQQEVEKRREEREREKYEKMKARNSAFAIKFNASIAEKKGGKNG